jgi:hypothetical protein
MRAFWNITSRSLVGIVYTLMTKAARTSELPVYSNETTRRYMIEGSHLHTRRRENLKSHMNRK